MAIKYLDFVNGNDANDGTTFATRWQTFTSGATNARINAGDVVRIIKSPDPIDSGVSATFNANVTVSGTFSSIVSTIHDCSTNWTANTNATSVTSAGNKIEGAGSELITATASFTTGLLAWTTVQNDGSGFQQISFMVRQNSGTLIADGNYTLNLYSDANATTLIAAMPISKAAVTNVWWANVYNFGSTFNTGQIQSIGIARATNTGAISINVDNIIAVKGPAEIDCITHKHLIAANTAGPWYSLFSITPTEITVNTTTSAVNLSTATPGTYESGPFTIKTRLPLFLPSSKLPTSATDTTFSLINKGGTTGNPITFSGGWSDVDGQTQTGQTYVSGIFGQGRLMSIPYGSNNIDVEGLCPVSFYGPFYLNGASNLNLTTEFVGQNQLGGIVINSGGNICSKINLIVGHATAGPHGILITNTPLLKECSWNITNLICNHGFGLNIGAVVSSDITVQNCRHNYSNNVNVTSLKNSTLTIDNASSSGKGNPATTVAACVINTVFDSTVKINSVTDLKSNASVVQLTGCINSDFIIGQSVGQGASYNFPISGCDNLIIHPIGPFTPNGVVGWPSYLAGVNGKIILVNTNINYSTNGSSACGEIIYQNYNGVTTDQRIYHVTDGSILTDSTIRHTSSGVSWKFLPTSTSTLGMLTMPLCKIALMNGVTTTVSIWMRRNNLGTTQGFMCKGNQINGITNDVLVSADNSIDTWTQYSMNLTSTETGVVEILGYAYGGNTCWFDDISIS